MPMFTTGQVISDGYRVVRTVARSRTGVLYECAALDGGLEPVAVKVVEPLAEDRSPDMGRLFRDITSISMLEHPNLVRIFEVLEIDFRDPCIIMELLPGRDLSSPGWTRSDPSQDNLLPVLRQVSAALEEIHREGLVHGALKPSNVLLVHGASEEDVGVVKVLDAGIYHAQRTQVTPGQPSAIGYLPYMAPEMAAGEIDRMVPATDVYLLGLLVYAALCGELPFEARHPSELVEQIRRQPPRRVSELAPHLPLAVQPVLARALVKDPDHRYQQVSEFVTDLEQALGEPAPREQEPAPREQLPAPWEQEPAPREQRPAPREQAPAPVLSRPLVPPSPATQFRKTASIPALEPRVTRILPGSQAPSGEAPAAIAQSVVQAAGTGSAIPDTQSRAGFIPLDDLEYVGEEDTVIEGVATVEMVDPGPAGRDETGDEDR